MNSTPKRFCENCGAPVTAEMRFCVSCGSPLAQVPPPTAAPVAPAPQKPAQTVNPQAVPPSAAPAVRAIPSAPPAYPQPPQARPYVPSPPPANAYPPPPQKKRKWRWLFCCILPVVIIGFIGLLVGGYYIHRNKFADSNKMSFGSSESLAAQTVPASGGEIDFTPQKSGLSKVTLSVPEGAYTTSTKFGVSLQQITSDQFGDTFNPLTPLITVTDSGGFAAVPMQVTLPVDIPADEFAMGFYYDRHSGTLEGIPLVSETANSITLATSHFSSIVIAGVKVADLDSISVDTGFRPGVDDWEIVNYGTYAAPLGACAGMSISAMWYYEERHLADGDPSLFGRFDNNLNETKTPGFQEDDSWAARYTSAVQRAINWNTYSMDVSFALGGADDRLTYLAFVYSMMETKKPQYVAIYRHYTDDKGKQQESGHAIVAYEVVGGNIYVSDPNKPGAADRSLSFDGEKFSPYASGDNAQDIKAEGDVAYPDIHYMGTSAMIDMEKVSSLYDEMLKGKAGTNLFIKETYEYQDGVDKNGNPIYKPLPAVLKVDKAWTLTNGEGWEDELNLRITSQTPFPRGVSTLYLDVFKDYKSLYSSEYNANIENIPIPLTPGVLNMGIETASKENNRIEFNDYYPFTVVYGNLDISGTWQGTMSVKEATKGVGLVQTELAKFLLQIGAAKDESDAQSLADSMIETNPQLTEPLPVSIVFTAAQTAGQYTYVANTLADDGSTLQTNGTAELKDGKVTFSFRYSDGSTYTFTGALNGNNRVDGNFTISAWGILPGAGSGTFSLTKSP